jgi:hypothetical protein
MKRTYPGRPPGSRRGIPYDEPYLAMAAGHEAWVCGLGGRETRIELDPETFAEVAFCHSLADPHPTQRRRKKR